MADEEPEKTPAAQPEDSGAAAPKKKAKKATRKAPAKKPAAKQASEGTPPDEVPAEPFDSNRDKGPTVDMPPPGAKARAMETGAALAAACHLLGLADLTFSILLIGLLAPLVLWLTMKDRYPEVDHHGKESINFQLNVMFWSLVSVVLIPCLGLGLLLLPALSIAELILIVLATVAAANGERYRYPMIYRILQ